MKPKATPISGHTAELRRQAEAAVREKPPAPAARRRRAGDTKRLLHELEVHQAELEKQNDELRAANARLEEARDRQTELYDVAPVGYLTLDEAGAIVEANLTASGLLGVERASLLQKALSYFVTPEDRDNYDSFFKRSRETEARQVCEMHLWRSDGTIFPAELGAVVARAAGGAPILHVTVNDISERQQTENALRESEADYRSLFENSLVGISQALPDGRLIRVNDAYARMYGYSSPEEMIAQVSDVGQQLYANPDDRQEVLRILQEKGVMEPREVAVRHRDGRPLCILASGRAIRDAQGRLRWYQAEHIDITDRKRAAEALQESEARFRGTVEETAAGYFMIDRGGCFRQVNAAWLRMHGYSSEEEILGRHFTLTQAETDLKYAQLTVDQLLSGETISGGEFSRRCKDGSTGYHTFTARPVSQAGQIVGLEGFLIDITERRRAEVAEREQRILAEALRDTAAAINQSLDQATVLERILENVSRVVPHDTANIALVRQGMVQVAQCRGYPPEQARPIRSLEVPLARVPNFRRMVEEGRPVIVADSRASSDWVDLGNFTRQQGAYLGVPIRSGGQVIGLLNLDSATPGFFTPAHAERLQAFADQAAIALVNARLYTAVRERVEELAGLSHRLRQELGERQRAEEKWRNLFEILPVGVSVVNSDNAVTEFNQALGDMLHITQAGMLRGDYRSRRYWRPDGTRMEPEEFPSLRAVSEHCAIRDVEIGVEQEDGAVIWTNVSAAPLSCQAGSVTVTTDITERKHAEGLMQRLNAELNRRVAERTAELAGANDRLSQEVASHRRAEAALIESQGKCDTLFDLMPVGVAILDAQGEIIRANAALQSLVSAPTAESVPDAFRRRRYFHPDGTPLAPDEYPGVRAVRDQATVMDIEVAAPMDDGAVAWRNISAAPLPFLDWRAVVIHADITARKQMELENVRLQQRADQAARLEERQRLARDLHDSAAQALYSLTLIAPAAKQAVLDNDPALAGQHLDHIEEAALSVLRDMRLLIYELRPAALEQTGLAGALRQRLELVEERVGLKVSFEVSEGLSLSPAQQAALYGIAQEALNNTLKHTRASEVAVRLKAGADGVVLEIADDGQGFDPAAPAATRGLGLTNMRDRAREAGGELSLASAPGRGTRIVVSIRP